MPPRFMSIAIVAGWLAVTGWWVYRETMLYAWFSEPPPYSIDLFDEVHAQSAAIDWSIWQDDQPVGAPCPVDPLKKAGSATTEIRYDAAKDVFELRGDFLFQISLLKLATSSTDFHSKYIVTPAGELREVRATIKARLKALAQDLEMNARAVGPVRNNQLTLKIFIDQSSLWKAQLIEAEPLTLPPQAGALNPLHPVNHIRGLRMGQRWRQPVVDPLFDSLREAIKRIGMPMADSHNPYLDAEVTQATLLSRFPGKDDEQIPCLLINYRNRETSVSTWVRAADEIVVQQEVFSPTLNLRLVLQRKDLPPVRPGAMLSW